MDRLAWIISSIHIPVTATSTRIADVLLSALNEVLENTTELPSKLLELVGDTLASTYPPEPSSQVYSSWLLRTITNLVDKCPPALLTDALMALQEGAAVWVADEHQAFTVDEYALNVRILLRSLSVPSLTDPSLL